MKHFCTVITSDHLYKALALFDSLKDCGTGASLHVLVINELTNKPVVDKLFVYYPQQLSKLENYQLIAQKYGSNKDKLRWSLKPVFLQYLLQEVGEKVIYLDADIYFYNPYDFLFDLLDSHNMLLTPHYYSTDPTHQQNWFEANFRVGLFNAGFVGANRQSIHLLKWWSACCAYRCEKNAFRGTFDDQKYLDLLPIMDENVHVVRHKGCNIADWNRSEIERTSGGNGVLLAGKYPLIFIHFNNSTIRAIAQGKEPLLKQYLQPYFENLKKYKPGLQLNDMYSADSVTHKLKYRVWKIITDAGFAL